MKILYRILVVLALMSVVEASLSFPFAAVRRGCTQEDGLALEIFLTKQPFQEPITEPSPPAIRIEVGLRPWNDLLEKKLILLPLSRAGIDRTKPIVRASLLSEQGTQQWLSGDLVLSTITPEKLVLGNYRFASSTEKWSGKFTAHWIASRSICG
jgi:hypothetical protein